jgi:predicted permease
LLARIRLWARALFSRRAVESEMSREMAFHIEMERERLVREGVPPDEAARRAKVAFGGVERFADDVRDERGTRWLDNLSQDVRFGLRQFARAPFATATMVMMLAVGIGVNSVLFAVIDATLLAAPSGIPANRSLVRIRGISRSPERVFGRGMSYAELANFRAQTETFSGVAGWATETVSIDAQAGADRASAEVQFVTSGFFDVLGVRASLGSALPTTRDTASTPYAGVMISRGFWRKQFAGSPQVIGKTMTVGGAIVTVVGVAPPGFGGAGWGSGATSIRELPVSAWIPLSARPAVTGQSQAALEASEQAIFSVVGRLHRGVSMGNASRVASSLGSRAGSDRPRKGWTTSADVVRLRANNSLDFTAPASMALTLVILGAATLLILAIICTTVSALLIGRAMTRKREIGMRLSLGATRARLVRQLVTESALLAIAGGACGLLLLFWLTRLGMHWFPDSAFSVGWWTIAATAVFALGTGVVFGLAPALHATRASVHDALKQSSATGTQQMRMQRRLVVYHIALSQPLLVGLGMLLAATAETERGRSTSDVANRTLVMHLEPQFGGRDASDERILGMTAQLNEQIATLPGVERVSNGVGWTTRDKFSVSAVDRAGSSDAFKAVIHPIGPGYFSLLNTRMLRGREFDRTDIKGAPPSIVIGRSLAWGLWGKADPIGKTLKGASVSYTVVGVVDADQAGPGSSDRAIHAYVALAQHKGIQQPAILIRVRARATAMIPQIRARVRQALPGTPVFDVVTLAEINARKQKESFVTSTVATGAGVLALLLASIGLYAVVAYAVGQRTREIGVRIALGAQRSQVVRQFFHDGIKLSLIGSAIGLPLSVLALRTFMRAVDFGGPGAWGVAGVIACVVTAVAGVATWIPARRAARVDPTLALRAD